MTEFKKTINGYNDIRLNNISWDMTRDPTEPGVLGWFIKDKNGNVEIIDIPHNENILGNMRPYRTMRLINLTIGISGCGDAKDCKQDTWMGLVTFPLRISLENHRALTEDRFVTLMDFFKAIYDFYHFQITHDEYKQLLAFTKKKDREAFFLGLNAQGNERNDEEKKNLRDWWAGSMYFEGYDSRSRTINYGT
jgi:hypothetical protein